MISPVLKHPSSFHRLLVSRVKLVSPSCRPISKLSAINKGLRSGRDDTESKRGGRDRPQRSSQSRDRPRSDSFQRSDAPPRTRGQGFGSGGRDRDRPAFKPRDDARDSTRDRPGRDSGSSYPRSTAHSDHGGRDETPPGFNSRDGAKSSFRERPKRDSGPSSSSRGAKPVSRPEGRLERLRKKESGYAGQPGFSFGREPGSKFASHGRRDGRVVDGSERSSIRAAGRRPEDDDAPGGRIEDDFTSSRESRFSGRRRDEPSESDSKFGSRSGYERRSEFSERRQDHSFTSKNRDDRPRAAGDGSGGKPGSTKRRERAEVAPAGSYSPTAEADLDQPESEQADRPRKGLFRDIKSACKLIQSIQKAEASGEDTGGMNNMASALLRSVNRQIESGDFKDSPSEAVASFFQKNASDGTFYLNVDEASGSQSVLFQRGDGKIDLAVKTNDKPLSKVRPARTDYNKDTPERASRAGAGNRTDRANSSREMRGSRSSDAGPEDDGIPISVPYTTAASEFLYGSNAVLAALRGKRRKLYQLYVHPKIFERESGMEADKKSRYAKPAHEFVALAKEANIPFRNEFRTHLLDKMSDGRPHNGVVLEVSKLPAAPVLGLGKPNARTATIPLTVAPQSAEDIAVNGNPDTISVTANTWRHPFVVMLDGILDPANVGNILRTCHFYGVDAVVVATNTCANLSSAVLAKASSGACEAVRILALPQPSNFVHDSAKAGWKIYAAVAPATGRQGKDARPQLTTAAVATASPLVDHPCILMLGAEGEGLRENLKNRANAFVSITRGQQLNDSPDVGVDSMNVSVAAGVLLESFLRKPQGAPEKRDSTGELGF